MAEYKYIIDVLEENGLTICPLHISKNASDTYQMSLLQPTGKIFFSENEVRNDSTNNAVQKYTKFLNSAYHENYEFVLTPEYSCPWNALQLVINDNFPDEGALWLLGCESITLSELNTFKENNPSIMFFHEPLQRPRAGRNFYSPVCYMFNAKNMDDEIKRIIFVQFKTEHMHDTDTELEISNLIYGTRRYWICNDINSIHISALICAEALDPLPIPLDINKSYLIAHLQLNTQPFNPSYSLYRKNIFAQNLNVEIISLNWAKEFQLGESYFSQYGGSAVYTKAKKVKINDGRINQNHDLGVYYSFENSMKYHIYNLNYDEHVFNLKNSNLLQTANVALLESRLGIESIYTLTWDTSNWITTSICDDKWNSYLSHYLPTLSRLPLSNSSAIVKERFLTLTSGNIYGSSEWKSPTKLDSFNVDTDGSCKHFSIHDNITTKQSVRQNVQRAINLDREIIQTPSLQIPPIQYPEKFQELYNNCELIAVDEEKYCQFNVCKSNDKFPATFVYVGEVSEIEAKEVFDKTAKALECAKRRLITWYKDSSSGQYDLIHDEKIAKIDDDCNTNSISIDKEDE